MPEVDDQEDRIAMVAGDHLVHLVVDDCNHFLEVDLEDQ